MFSFVGHTLASEAGFVPTWVNNRCCWHAYQGDVTFDFFTCQRHPTAMLPRRTASSDVPHNVALADLFSRLQMLDWLQTASDHKNGSSAYQPLAYIWLVFHKCLVLISFYGPYTNNCWDMIGIMFLFVGGAGLKESTRDCGRELRLWTTTTVCRRIGQEHHSHSHTL